MCATARTHSNFRCYKGDSFSRLPRVYSADLQLRVFEPQRIVREEGKQILRLRLGHYQRVDIYLNHRENDVSTRYSVHRNLKRTILAPRTAEGQQPKNTRRPT